MDGWMDGWIEIGRGRVRVGREGGGATTYRGFMK